MSFAMLLKNTESSMHIMIAYLFALTMVLAVVLDWITIVHDKKYHSLEERLQRIESDKKHD